MADTARRLALIVPAQIPLTDIHPRSAIVGTPSADGRWVIDFAGNVHGSANLDSYEDRLQSAAGRHVAHYPTVARLSVPRETIRIVGHARHSEALRAWIVEDLTDPEALSEWLGTEDLPRISGSRALWDRAAGLLISRGKAPKVATLAARRGLDVASAAFLCIQESEPGLTAP